MSTRELPRVSGKARARVSTFGNSRSRLAPGFRILPQTPEHLTVEQHNNISFFLVRVFDRDGNGFISTEELHYVVTTFGETLTDKEAEELIAMFDKNKDGKLEYEEFVTWAKNSLAEYLKSL